MSDTTPHPLPSTPLPIGAPVQLRQVAMTEDLMREIAAIVATLPKGAKGCLLASANEQIVRGTAVVEIASDARRSFQVFGGFEKPRGAAPGWAIGAQLVWR